MAQNVTAVLFLDIYRDIVPLMDIVWSLFAVNCGTTNLDVCKHFIILYTNGSYNGSCCQPFIKLK